MSLPPSDWAEDALENPSLGEANPVEWENPEWSSLSALLATLRRVLLQPRSFFTNLPLTGGLGEPLGFALLVGTTGVLSSFLWQLVLEGGFSETMPVMALSKQMGNLMNDPRVIVGIFMLSPFLVILGQFFLSVCLLWAARLTGPGDTTFESVFRIAAYAQAPAVICLIPWGGAFIAGSLELDFVNHGIIEKIRLLNLEGDVHFVPGNCLPGGNILTFPPVEWGFGTLAPSLLLKPVQRFFGDCGSNAKQLNIPSIKPKAKKRRMIIEMFNCITSLPKSLI